MANNNNTNNNNNNSDGQQQQHKHRVEIPRVRRSAAAGPPSPLAQAAPFPNLVLTHSHTQLYKDMLAWWLEEPYAVFVGGYQLGETIGKGASWSPNRNAED